jgi:hypothetical protein
MERRYQIQTSSVVSEIKHADGHARFLIMQSLYVNILESVDSAVASTEIAVLFFAPNLVSRCRTDVIRAHNQCCTSDYYSVFPNHFFATIYLNNGRWSFLISEVPLLRSTWFQQWEFHHAIDRRTDRHGGAQRMFFAHART